MSSPEYVCRTGYLAAYGHRTEKPQLYTEQNFRYFSAFFIVDIYRNEISLFELFQSSFLCHLLCLSGF